MRSLAAGLCILALATGAGCRDSSPARSDRAAKSTTSTTAPLAPAVAWVPTASEVEPALKQIAAEVMRTLFTYGRSEGTVEAARARLDPAIADTAVADAAGPLLRATAEAAADVLYPQMGGLSGNRAAVMVVTRLRWREAGGDASETRTFDVRLIRREESWRVEALASLGGGRPDRPAPLSTTARQVLEHPNIDLPDSARWDIEAGRVTNRVLEVLRSLGDAHRVRVAVLSSGHPVQVFGKVRTSNHIPGRAVDVWWLDGPVVEQRAPDGPLRAVVRQLLDAGVTELGAPFDIDGAPGTNFANLVHQDHLHIGFDSA